jgi:hypothetical protein
VQEILRAYNAAPGPPSKGDVKPSAPPEASSPPPSEAPNPFPAGAKPLAPSKGSMDFGACPGTAFGITNVDVEIVAQFGLTLTSTRLGQH